jgi:hypothetical protein
MADLGRILKEELGLPKSADPAFRKEDKHYIAAFKVAYLLPDDTGHYHFGKYESR